MCQNFLIIIEPSPNCKLNVSGIVNTFWALRGTKHTSEDGICIDLIWSEVIVDAQYIFLQACMQTHTRTHKHAHNHVRTHTHRCLSG